MTTEKYTTDLPEAVLGDNGLAIKDGWIVIYNADTTTREYRGASRDYIQSGVGLPAGAYLDAPVITKDKTKAICRTKDGRAWELLDDFRGQTMYNTETHEPMLVSNIGPIVDGWTLLKPVDNFSVWNGNEWEDDTAARHAYEVKAATAEREQCIKEAEQAISILDRMIKLEIATDEEVELQAAWSEYSVLVYRIDPEDAPDITWPDKPA